MSKNWSLHLQQKETMDCDILRLHDSIVEITSDIGALFLSLCPLSLSIKLEFTYFKALVASLDIILSAHKLSVGNMGNTCSCFKLSITEEIYLEKSNNYILQVLAGSREKCNNVSMRWW